MSSELERRLEEHNRNITDLSNRLDNHEGSITSLQTALSELTEAISKGVYTFKVVSTTLIALYVLTNFGVEPIITFFTGIKVT